MKNPSLTEVVSIYTTKKKGSVIYIVETLDPRYEMPKSKYFSNTAFPELFEKTRERVVTEIIITSVNIFQLLQVCGLAQQ